MTKDKKLNNLPAWDLSDFYSSIEDKKISADLNKIEKAAQKLSQEFAKKIAKLDGKELADAIKKYEKVSELIGRVHSYSYLIYAGDLSDAKSLAFYQNISEKLSEYQTNLVFFTIEINKISDKKLAGLYKESAALTKYQPFIRDVRSFKKYQLSQDLEEYGLEKSSSGRSAWVRLFDETVNNLKFNYRKKTLNSQEIFNLLSNHDEKVRKDAAKAIGKTFKDNAKIFAYITNVLAKEKSTEDKWRGFASPISSRNLNNCVEDEVVDILVSKVKENYKNISHRYYKVKAKILGKKKLNHWDRNAPLSKGEDKVTSWNDAKKIVLDAYNEFSPKLKDLGQQFFDKNWIDAQVRNGKDSGAFSHSTVPSVHPYILMNYQGKTRDIMTLAHELGHGVHQCLAAKQGALMCSTPLTLAETASVFGEQLTFQKILKSEKNKDKKNLIIAGKIEDMINTAVRQIAFLEFERKVHDARKNGEISLDELCGFWMEVQKESLGPIFKYDEEYKYFWSYIPHFIHSPFYVYSYAFGDCLVNSLYGVYKSGKVSNFEKKYMQMLEYGGTKHHKEMLEPFGLDAKDPAFWQSGLDVIIDYIDQLEKEL